MRLRWSGPVDSNVADEGTQLLSGWLRTAGAGVPTIDSSYGVSSITDAGVGLLDVTWARPFGTATSYVAVVSIQHGALTRDSGGVDETTPPTATVLRAITVNGEAFASVDPSGGYFVLAVGI